MRYRYRSDDELKDSGVEWIERFPKNSEIVKLKHRSTFINGYAFKSEDLNIDSDVPIIRIGDIKENGLDLHSMLKVNKELTQNLNLYKIENGDTLIAMSGATVGKSMFIVNSNGELINQRVGIIRPKDINSKYLYYSINNRKFKKEVLLSSVGGAQENISSENIKDKYIIKHDKKEQEKIANFLDEKTSQFDLIISKKEKLIERLEEAKKSLISEVVTGKVKVVKTNDGYELVNRSSEEMKDSGVNWLGDIPKDWEYGQLKYLCNYITDGAHISPEIENGIYPFLSVKDLKNGHLDFKNCLLTSSNNYEYLKRNSCNPKLGDVLISKDGTIGKTVTIEYDKNFVVASSLVILRPKKFLQPKYFEYILNSKSAQEQINSFVKGAALPRISITHLKEILLPFTRDIIEQGDIVDYLSIELNRIDSILYKIKLQIEKLKEAKQSLISEAVTGKIEILD